MSTNLSAVVSTASVVIDALETLSNALQGSVSLSSDLGGGSAQQ